MRSAECGVRNGHRTGALESAQRSELSDLRLTFLDCLELLRLRFGGVVAVQRVAAADQPVARGRGAIAKGAAYGFGREGPLPYRIRQYPRVGQHHAPDPDEVGPVVAQDMLRHVWQVFLQVAVSGADQQQI